MNNRFIKIIALITSSIFFASGCGDNSSFETPDTSGTPTNTGTISQANFSVGATDPFPMVYDPATGFSEESVEIVVKVGDLNNQLLTDKHTVFFKTEWGLIEPSCTTEAGKCSVTWQTSKPENIPSDLFNTITAWTIGEESFEDTNGNGKFDDADMIFNDLEEPFVDADENNVFNSGDSLVDVVNANDLTGANGAHDIGDGFLNSPNCTHSSLCSTIRKTTFVWDITILDLAGPPPAVAP